MTVNVSLRFHSLEICLQMLQRSLWKSRPWPSQNTLDQFNVITWRGGVQVNRAPAALSSSHRPNTKRQEFAQCMCTPEKIYRLPGSSSIPLMTAIKSVILQKIHLIDRAYFIYWITLVLHFLLNRYVKSCLDETGGELTFVFHARQKMKWFMKNQKIGFKTSFVFV